MEIIQSEYDMLPHIDQRTIECDLRAFTRWLNRLADRANWLTNIYVDLKNQVDKNTEDIRKIKIKLDEHDQRIHNLEVRMENVENILNNMGQDMSNVNGVLEMINGRIDMLYSWLPVPYGMIDPLGWKFGMGNINATSTTDGPSDINGPGIYTSSEIEDNDINFNAKAN